MVKPSTFYASIDDRSGTIRALLSLGRVWQSWGFPSEAADRYRLAESLARYSDDSRLMRSALNHRADLLIREDDPAGALALLEDPADDEGNPAPDPAAGRGKSGGNSAFEVRRSTNWGGMTEAMAALEAAVGVALDAGRRCRGGTGLLPYGVHFLLGRRLRDRSIPCPPSLWNGTGRRNTPQELPPIFGPWDSLPGKAGRDDLAEDYFRRSWLAWRGLGRNDEAERTRKDLEEVTGEPVREP